MQNTVNLKIGDIFRHFKGDYYKIVCIARDSETTELLVVYEGQYISKEFGKKPIWVRPLSNFTDYKEMDGKKIKRFEKVDKIPEDYNAPDSEGRFMVSAGSLIKNLKTNKFLILKKSNQDEWSYISGRMKQGEEIEAALKREIFEETGLQDIKIIKLLSAWHGFRGEEKQENELIVLSYLCTTDKTDVVLSKEHSEYNWVSKDELKNFIEKGLYESIKNGLD